MALRCTAAYAVEEADLCYCGAFVAPHPMGLGACYADPGDILCEDCLRPASETYSPGQASVGIPGGYVSACCRSALIHNNQRRTRVY